MNVIYNPLTHFSKTEDLQILSGSDLKIPKIKNFCRPKSFVQLCIFQFLKKIGEELLKIWLQNVS